ncbi:hypothetical protein F5B21DRAFT_526969 [Xylaria acuta]|nr:hypothetical protein F5B21DRAFT_526969 [Xylaria acuta]
MATEHTGKPSPKLHRFKQFGHQIDSQASGIIESNFIAPLEDSQETQDVASDWHDNDGGHETDVINQPPQSTKGPFISRPQREDLLDFQNGFQYSKAPIPQSLPAQPSTPPKGMPRQSGSKNDGVVRTGHQFRGTDRPTASRLFHDARDICAAGTQVSEPPPNTKEKTHDAVSIDSDARSDSAMSGNDRDEKRGRGTVQDDPTLRPPFQITSPLSKISAPFQRPKGNIHSPAAKLGEPKLSKAFSDIQRKALIQSTHTHYHAKSQIDKVSPSMFNKPKLHQDATDIPELSNTRARQHQEQLTSDYALNRPPATPEGQILAAVQASRNNRSNTARMTRPYTRYEDEDYNMRTRSESRASNISKSRAPPMLKHKPSQRRQASRTIQESNAYRQKLAESWNRYFVREDSQKKHWEKKMEYMVKELAERDYRIAEYLAKIQNRDQVIMDLKTANEEQHTIYQKQEGVLAELEKRRQGLQGKMKEYKNHLNDSTKEQQDIFKYFQPRYHEMREQIRQAEHNHQSSLEQALSTTDKIRDKIRKSVEEVRTLSQEEIQKLRIEIVTLQEKLAARENEVDTKKNYINDLRQELKESHEMNKDALKVLNTQNQELMKTSNEGTIQVQNIGKRLNQQGLEIQSLLELLENNRANTVSHSELAQSLKALQTEVSDSVLSEFRKRAASDRELSSKATMGLKAEILAIHEVCTGLGKQIQDKQSASEWRDKYGKVQMEHQILRSEMDRLENELIKMKDEARTQLDQHEDLQQELATLRASAEAAGEAKNRIKNLEEVKQKIHESLDEKEKCIRGLEEKLRSAEEALSTRNRQLEDQERQILDEQEKHKQAIAGCLEQQEQAVEQAKTEVSARACAQYQTVQKCLQGAEQNCSRLQQELVQVKQGAEEALRNKEDESARQMQETMEPTVARIDEVLDGLQALEQEKGDLAASLEAWSNDHIELSLLQQVVQKLAKDQQTTIGNGKQLWELLDVQKKLEGTWQSHRSEVDAIKRATELEKSINAERERESRRGHKGKRPTKISHVANRRVTIQFPGEKDADDGTVVPVSIEEERATRRQAASPTGIMKPALLQVEGRSEGPYHQTPLTTKETRGRPGRRVANRGATPALVSHSAYNRPVLGTEELASDINSGNTGTVFTDMSSTMKRKRAESKTNQRENTEGRKPRSSEKRPAKISRSMSSYFHDPIPKEPVTESIQQHTQPGRSRGGPINRRPRSFVTYGSMSLSTQ